MGIREFWSDFWYPHRVVLGEVSADEAEQAIRSANSPGLVDELYEFGQLMLDEVLSRTAQIDSKATSLLGWSAAVLGVMLLQIGEFGKVALIVDVLTLVGVLLAGSASIQAGLALRAVHWQIPSEVDWFKRQLFRNADDLRVYHLLGMLETHQHHNRQNKLKGWHVWRSQWLLVGASVLVAIIIVLK